MDLMGCASNVPAIIKESRNSLEPTNILCFYINIAGSCSLIFQVNYFDNLLIIYRCFTPKLVLKNQPYQSIRNFNAVSFLSRTKTNCKIN